MKQLRLLTILFFCLSASVLPAANVDNGKIRHSVGAGNSVSAIIVKWNETGDRAGNIDALVWGVRYDGSTTVGSALETLFAEDKRIVAVECDGLKALSFATYTRRNMTPRIKIGTSSKTVGASGVYTVTAAELPNVGPMYASEKWQKTDNVNQWRFFVKRADSETFVVADTNTLISSGDVIAVDYGNAAQPADCPYIFYVPPYDGTEYLGCYVPDMEVSSSATAVIPFYFNAYSASKAPGTSNTPARITVTPSSAFSGISANFNPAASANFDKYYYTATPAVSEGEAQITIAWQSTDRAYFPAAAGAPFTGTVKIAGNDCKLKSLNFNPDKLALPLGATAVAKPVLMPTDATDEPLNLSVSGNAISYNLETGLIETLSVGTSSITVTAANAPSVKATLSVTVGAPQKPLTAIAFDSEQINVPKGGSIILNPVFSPADADYTKLNLTSANSYVADVDALGTVIAKNIGTATITAIYAYNPSVKASVKVNVVAANPVQSIDFSSAVGSDGAIHLPYAGVLALKPDVLPETADMRDFETVIANESIAETYSVVAYDYFLNKYPELIGRSTGTTSLQFRATDGSGTVSPVYKVVVDAPDRSEPSQNGYRDGFFWINEDWYTHTNGSLNYIDADGNVHYRAYEAQNPWKCFGATSQYGTVWGDRLYVLSKQSADNGDPRSGGGRLVVADATTLRRITSHTTLGGDSRACAGASIDKIYIGLVHDVVPYSISTQSAGNKLDLSNGFDTGSADTYGKQTGDMACTSTHLWVIRQDTGTYVVDINTDETVAFFGGYAPHALTESADGNIWVAADGRWLICYDGTTLQEIKRLDNVNITCQWSTWRSPSLCGAVNENVLYWMSGNTLYAYDIDRDERRIVYTHTPRSLPQYGSQHTDTPYGSGRFDNAAGMWVYATTLTGSSLYSHVWYNFVDVKTGTLAREVQLDRYYWFPAIPVFPLTTAADEPVIACADPIRMNYAWGDKVIDLTKYIHNPAAIDKNIRIHSIDCGDAHGILDGQNLVAKGLWLGTNNVKINGESAGRPFETTLTFVVPDMVGVSDVESRDNVCVMLHSDAIELRGCKNVDVRLFNTAGVCVAHTRPDSEVFHIPVPEQQGIYIVTTSTGHAEKIIVR